MFRLGGTEPAADGGVIEVTVEGAALDAEHGGDLGHGVFALVVQPLSGADLVDGQCGAAAAVAAASSRGGQTVAGVGHDEFPLQLGQHR